MKVDLAKIFPKACLNQGIDRLIVDTQKIEKLEIDESLFPAEYCIKVGKIEYRLPAIGNEDNNALQVLSTIKICEKMPGVYKELLNLMSLEPSESLLETLKLNKETLNYCRSKYGATISLPKNLN